MASTQTALPHDATSDPGRWLVLALMVAGYAAYNLDKSILAVLIEPLKAEFLLDDRQMGLLSAAMAIPVALFCIPLGRAVDRVSRKHLSATLLIGWSVMTGLGGLATSVPFLVLARCGVGAFESGYVPASMSILADEFPVRRRPTAMGVFGLGAPVGLCLGMAIGGLVAVYWGWRAAFFIAGAPGIIIAILILLFVREPLRGRLDPIGIHTDPVSFPEALRLWQTQPASLFAALGMTSSAVLLAATSAWTPSFLARTQQIGLGQAGLYAALVVGVAGALGAAAGGWAADWVGENRPWLKPLVPTVGLLLSVVTGLAGFVGIWDLGPAVAILAASAFFAQTYIGPGYATTLSLVPPPIRGTVASILLLSFGVLSYGVGTALVGYVSQHLAATMGARSLGGGIAATLIFSCIGALCFWRSSILMRAHHSHSVEGVMLP